jgi:hypothetical protein
MELIDGEARYRLGIGRWDARPLSQGSAEQLLEALDLLLHHRGLDHSVRNFAGQTALEMALYGSGRWHLNGECGFSPDVLAYMGPFIGRREPFVANEAIVAVLRRHAASARLPHVLIRYRVGATFATLPVGHDDRELLHFVYGCNRSVDAATADAEATARAADEFEVRAMSVKQLKKTANDRRVSLVGCLEKADIVSAVLAATTAEADDEPVGKTVPDDVFELLCRCLVG